MKFAVAFAVLALAAASRATSEFKFTSLEAPFLEQFGQGWEERWKASNAMKKDVQVESASEGNEEELYRYRGEWNVEEAAKSPLPGKAGLVVKTPAAHHAISVAFPKPVDPESKELVIQYDLKLQEGLECGGAYIKLLTESPSGIQYQEFDDKTPYTIMFGPDRCGNTNKVHFIFRHRNPKTGEYEEKHLRAPPAIVNDDQTNLYTLVIRPDNTYAIRINDQESSSGSLLDSFEPPVNPPKEIDDPEDKKPEDWVDEPKIADREATKPEDWDEEAPRMVADEEAVKPENWLESEPEFVADPSANKPEDWDDEEDGEWTAPQVPNPVCAEGSGCGPWKRPQKPNPNFKGKWYPPLIDNPAYKGPWAPRKIANPDYYEDTNPSKLNKIMGIGIELWTMQAGIMFDNFYVGHSLDDAKQLAEETWRLKRDIEKAVQEEKEATEKDAAEKDAAEKADATEAPAWESMLEPVVAFLMAASVDPVKAAKEEPMMAGLLLLLVVAPTILYMMLRSSSAKDVEYAKRKKQDVSTKDDEGNESQSAEADDEKEDLKPRRRKVNKE